MALQAIPGSKQIFVGPNAWLSNTTPVAVTATVLDAANEAIILIGRIETSDGASHTIDTTGSSSIQFRTAGVTFANGSTSLSVGIAAVDTSNGPTARAVNVADVITFDVKAVLTSAANPPTANAWQTKVPTTGTKTIANGDLVAVCIQMTARGGADTVSVSTNAITTALNRPVVTQYTGASYAAAAAVPNVLITFSDGALGWISFGDVFTSFTTRTWNSGDATKEYGQLFSLPFGTKIYGAYGWLAPAADCDVVLYSDPLGTPVAEKTVSIDLNVVAVATGRKFAEYFSSPYTYTANTNIGIVFKPGGTNVSAYLKTLNSATHRVTDPWGTSGYGISRASGAFANANSSLDHYYIGLIVGAFDDAVSTAPVGRLVSAQRGSPY